MQPEFCSRETLLYCFKKWITFTKSYRTTTNQHISFKKANPNRKSKPSMGKFIKGTKVVIPFFKGLSKQDRHTLVKYKIRVFFKGTSTIKSTQASKWSNSRCSETDIIYHQKCPYHNCTAEYIGEHNRSLKEWVSDHRNQTTETTTSLQYTQKQNIKIQQ